MGFKLLDIEAEASTEELNDNDILNIALDDVDNQLAAEEKFLTDAAISIQLAQESVEKIDTLIAMDKQALEDNTVNAMYINLSKESYAQAVSTIGMNIEVSALSLEAFGEADVEELIKLSIEEKEEAKKGILAKIAGKFKDIGQSIKNTMKLASARTTNNLKLISGLSNKLKNIESEGAKELNPADMRAVTRVLSKYLVGENVTEIKADNIVKYFKEAMDISIQSDVISKAESSLDSLTKSDYDYHNAKFALPKSNSAAVNKVYDDALEAIPVDKEQVMSMHYMNYGTKSARVVYMYAVENKNNMGHKVIKATNVSIPVKKSSDITNVELPSISDLEKLLKLAEDAVKEDISMRKKLEEFYNKSIATHSAVAGDYSLAVIISFCGEAGFFTKGILHAINVLASRYATKK